MKKDDILIHLAQDCPDITLTWDWGDYELQVSIIDNEATYFLADCKYLEIIEKGNVTDIEAIQRLIDKWT